MSSGIYYITNTQTGMLYIGSSSRLKKREREHFGRLKNNNHCNSHLQSAYNKYGEDSFVFIVVEKVPQKKLVEAEQRHIDLYDFSADLYNQAPFANCPMAGKNHTPQSIEKMRRSMPHSPMKGRRHTKEAKRRMSNAHKGKKLSKETVEKLRRANTGRKRTKKQRENISKSKMGEMNPMYGKRGAKSALYGKTGALSHTSKPVCQIDPETLQILAVYASAREAEMVTGIRSSHIGEVCNKRPNRKTSGGFRWEFVT